jgi:exosortase N
VAVSEAVAGDLVMTYLLVLSLVFYAGWRSSWLWRLGVLALASPLLTYLSAVFGFAIRLQLSAWAGTLLRTAGFAVTTEGNLLILNQQVMSVDPACMGVQMMGFTLLVGVFWLIAAEKRHRRSLPLAWVLACGGVAFGLVLASNLARIVVLVGFGIGPNHALHVPVGLACVLVYAWLPLACLANRLTLRFGVAALLKPIRSSRSYRFFAHWDKLALAALLLLVFTHSTKRTYAPQFRAGYVQVRTSFGFTQYSRPGVLVYLKPLPDWYSAEHSPAICWRGQGYTLRHIREGSLAGQPVYLAELQKGNHRLHTAWWFSNGHHRSIGQLDVRSRMLAGEPGFALINVTTTDAGKLRELVKEWL